MAGFSITLTSMEPEWVELWTASSDTPLVLPSGILTADAAAAAVVHGHVTSVPAEATAGSDRAVLDRFSQNVSRARTNLSALDQLVGDGDFGDNLAGGVQRALVLNASGTDGMTALADAFLDDVGGTSGPLFGLLFQQLAVVSFADDRAPDVQAVADAAAASYAAIHRVGGAEVGDCTLMDALAPAAEALATAAREGSDSPFTTAAEAAVQGALDTAALAPRRGRASYVGEHAIGVADPGALGVALLFSALAHVYDPTRPSACPTPSA